MIRAWHVYSALALAASAAAVIAGPPITIMQQTVIRIRITGSSAAPAEMVRPVEWKEHKGPRCIPLGNLGGAAITHPNSVDLVLHGGERVRALLERGCSAREFFYSGFYLTPTADGHVCAKRDQFHARIGGDCGITKFKSLRAR
ncbi:MAG: hypothetical protein KGQ42_07720 [Alphaproteobacteria bacterium]|nr:hypothetical protein [Alphaproteobacteria bacterium]MDE2042053.1 hypothetical protein [Alphaproteobacteria bacterium]MDE2340092.1 hypothetical protein [Alphaproteobacteria bacterium]